ncbi:MAG: ATP-binding protein [Ectothiorhodospiraceae bacterium]|nr:ATP-binding protein [Ectothiorhodospiraceae bacterium]
MSEKSTLHLLCGKMAAGKSTLARELTIKHNAILVVEDDWLKSLFGEEITSFTDYLQYSSRLKNMLFEHIQAMLLQGVTVVLDFPANTIDQRKALRVLFENTASRHVLHYLEATDALCKRQLRERSKALPAGAVFTSDAEFDAITQYFQPPSDDEGLMIKRYLLGDS